MVSRMAEMTNQDVKLKVRDFWDETPCGTTHGKGSEGSLEFFEEIEEKRYKLEPFIHQCAQFSRWYGKKVLEVGCGIGTDFLQFARAGADLYGIDLSRRSIELVERRLKLYGLKGRVLNGDAENLPFKDNTFDLVYSWGVIHHTPDTQKAIDEIHRTLKPGGKAIVMVYHKFSLLVLRILLLKGILTGELFTKGFQYVLNKYTENANQKNPLTRCFSQNEAKRMFKNFSNIQTKIFLTSYETHRIPKAIVNILPNSFGWFMCVSGTKPDHLRKGRHV